MKFALVVSVCSLLAAADAAETVLGAYIFHRHGDRSPKSLAPTSLSTLGYSQVHGSGEYFRERYLTGPTSISGLNKDTVKLSQVAVTAPVDNVLQNSATAFLQGLYPPVGQTVQTLADGTTVEAPMDGYQLVPVNTIATNGGSEDSGWLQDASLCANAKVSSNSYFASAEFDTLRSRTREFYASLVPVVNATLDEDEVTYKNAYIVYDLINVAEIQNSTIPSSEVLTEATLFQLRTLADAHEWGLAYNASDKARAIQGMQLAGEIVNYMKSTVTAVQSGTSANKLGIQFGAYATFLSLFGLLDLPKANQDFTGIPNYASSIVFELFTDADISGGAPKEDDLQVRFLFHNGTASNDSQPIVYPLFGGTAQAVPWSTFTTNMNTFAISSTQQWCQACGNSTGTCAQYASSRNSGAESSTQSSGSGSGLSPAVGGVIGAFVTLAVVLGLLAALMLLAGLRLERKRARLGRESPGLDAAGEKA